MSLAIQFQSEETIILDKSYLNEQLEQLTNQLESIHKLVRNKVRTEIKLDYDMQMSRVQSIAANIEGFA